MSPKRKAETLSPSIEKKPRTRAVVAELTAAAAADAKARKKGTATRSTPVRDGFDEAKANHDIGELRRQKHEERAGRQIKKMEAENRKHPKGAIVQLVKEGKLLGKYAIRCKEFPFMHHLETGGKEDESNVYVLTLCTCLKTTKSDSKHSYDVLRVHEYDNSDCPANSHRLSMLAALDEQADSTQLIRTDQLRCNFPYAMHVQYSYEIPSGSIEHSHLMPQKAVESDRPAATSESL
jgi:hypothetical protein